VSTVDPDEGKDPQPNPDSGGSESEGEDLRGPWEGESDTQEADDPGQPASGDDTEQGDTQGGEEEGGTGGTAPERGPWE
jgi:hypothetical protein